LASHEDNVVEKVGTDALCFGNPFRSIAFGPWLGTGTGFVRFIKYWRN